MDPRHDFNKSNSRLKITNFVFYDLETSGLSPAFDQPLQFAAIVTNGDLVELDKIDIRCQIAPHILPSPHALHLTNIQPERTVEPSLPNPFEFAQTLQGFINKWSPACWLGYNTIAFDEPMMRQLFYQNLQPKIFATQMNGNTRLDVMKMVMTTYAENPDALIWPAGDNGKTSFKLDRLAPANGFTHANAHDALSDVEATIYLFHKIKSCTPSLFEKLVKVQDKAIIKAELKNYLPMEVTLRFGGNPPRTYQGCYCGASEDNPNLIGFADFNLNDASDLARASKSKLAEFIKGTPKKIRTLALNKSESFRVIDDPTAPMLQFCEIVKRSTNLTSCVSQILDANYEKHDDADLQVEEQIHQEFINLSDKDLLLQFQRGNWAERASIIENFEDIRLRQLGQRLIAFYAPELLSNEQKNILKEFIRNRWFPNVKKVPWTTADDIWCSLDDLGSQIDSERWHAFYKTRIATVHHHNKI